MTLFQTLNDLACLNILMSITMATNLPIPILYGWKNLGSKLIFVLLLCKHRNKLQEDNVSTCCTTMKWKIQKPVKWTNYIYHYCTLNNHRIMTIFQTLNDLACPNIVMSIRMATKRHITVFWVFIYLNKVGWFSPLPCPITCNLLYSVQVYWILRGGILNITIFRCWNHRADELQRKIIEASYLSWMKCHTLKEFHPSWLYNLQNHWINLTIKLKSMNWTNWENECSNTENWSLSSEKTRLYHLGAQPQFHDRLRR